MRAPWSARRFLALGVLFLAAGLAAYVWEIGQEGDVELIELPLLLVAALFLFEGYVSWRRGRIAPTDNPK